MVGCQMHHILPAKAGGFSIQVSWVKLGPLDVVGARVARDQVQGSAYAGGSYRKPVYYVASYAGREFGRGA